MGVAGGIFYLSIVTVPPEQIAPKPGFVPHDKWRHFPAYGAFGASLAYALTDYGIALRRKVATEFFVALTYGIGIEAGQAFLPLRYFGIGDALANGIGAGLSLGWYLVEARLRLVSVPSTTISVTEH